jgi:hypothetical protein
LLRENPNSSFLFLSERKAPLSIDGAQRLIERLGVAAGFTFPIHAHMLCHSDGRGHRMHTQASLVVLAKICAQQAHITQVREVARELWRMALEYQGKAAALDNGQLPDIGPPPSWFKKS